VGIEIPFEIASWPVELSLDVEAKIGVSRAGEEVGGNRPPPYSLDGFQAW